MARLRLGTLVRGKVHALSNTKISIGVVEVNIGKDVSQESFGALKSMFQCFDILRGWIASPV